MALHRDVGVSTKVMSRTSLITDVSKSVTTEGKRQEWELPCDYLEGRRDLIKV